MHGRAVYRLVLLFDVEQQHEEYVHRSRHFKRSKMCSRSHLCVVDIRRQHLSCDLGFEIWGDPRNDSSISDSWKINCERTWWFGWVNISQGLFLVWWGGFASASSGFAVSVKTGLRFYSRRLELKAFERRTLMAQGQKRTWDKESVRLTTMVLSHAQLQTGRAGPGGLSELSAHKW